MVEFISIVVLTFALALIVLGLITVWLERGIGRLKGVALLLVGMCSGCGFSFLGSRYSLALFNRLIVRVDLPALMSTAFTYTAGVLGGIALAVGLFLWATGRFRNQADRTAVAFIVAGVLVVLIATVLAVLLSSP